MLLHDYLTVRLGPSNETALEVGNARSAVQIGSRARRTTQWSNDHEPRRRFGSAMLEIGWRHALKERRLDGSDGYLANPEE
jgi:hypothetical protein